MSEVISKTDKNAAPRGENNALWNAAGMTKEAFQSLPPQEQAELAKEILKQRQTRDKRDSSNTKWAAIAAIGVMFAIASMVWTEHAWAEEPDNTAQPATNADKCFFQTIDKLREESWQRYLAFGDNPNRSLQDNFSPQSLSLLAKSCETQTGTEVTDRSTSLINKGFSIRIMTDKMAGKKRGPQF
ncbi:MAG: hypothetical protein H6867_06970 [Rhodospirillales bacterium]|nr:hypothetical protein [Rhodospirillales bacterium]MCB9995291.1 hypothetical protein [Rhodospirillales bacterium]